jgi:hypothetical protein
VRRGLASQELVVGGEISGRVGAQRAPGAVGQGHAQRVGNLARDLGLHLEDVGERGVELLHPAGAAVWPERVSTSSGVTRTRRLPSTSPTGRCR